jgi:homoserine kinase type II
MKHVFMLWHTHGEDDDERDANLKLIGVYSSENEAESAKTRKLQHEGFRDTPDGFEIEKIELNRDQWSEGYITVSSGGVRQYRH